jgi:hypothetical protein
VIVSVLFEEAFHDDKFVCKPWNPLLIDLHMPNILDIKVDVVDVFIELVVPKILHDDSELSESLKFVFADMFDNLFVIRTLRLFVTAQ